MAHHGVGGLGLVEYHSVNLLRMYVGKVDVLHSCSFQPATTVHMSVNEYFQPSSSQAPF